MEIISLILYNFMPSNTRFEVRLENSCTITGQDCHHRRAQSSHQSGKQVKPRAWEWVTAAGVRSQSQQQHLGVFHTISLDAGIFFQAGSSVLWEVT